jgi:hypothetical protein
MISVIGYLCSEPRVKSKLSRNDLSHQGLMNPFLAGCLSLRRTSQLVRPRRLRPSSFSLTACLLFSGFFGIPVEDQYNLAVMIESPGFNCTLSPYAMVRNVALP